MFNLATVICFKKSLDSEELFGIFNDPESTPLKEIQDETFMVLFLKKYEWTEFCNETQRNVLWHVCKKNFNEAFYHIKESILQIDFLKIIMERDINGNNSFMIAANAESGLVLMSLLSSSVCSTDDMKIKNECLHQDNNSGDTLLKLIMSHGDKMSVHREILIETEREYHRRSSSIEGKSSRLSLAECFKKNIGQT